MFKDRSVDITVGGRAELSDHALDVTMEAGIVAFVKDVDACIEALERVESAFA